MSEFPASSSQQHSALVAAAQHIIANLGYASISVVLGSGLGNFVANLENPSHLLYKDIPYMPKTDVIGHAGKLYIGDISGRRVYCWSGRIHAYEGFENFQTGTIAHLSAHLGCHTILITNASGGAIPGMVPGCVLLINDFVNLHGRNPLDTYYHAAYSPQHIIPAFKPEMLQLFRDLQDEVKLLPFYEGTYMWCTGPTYETPYEIACYTKLGGHLVGMSTVPEILAAVSHRMNFVVLSVITNMAAGITGAPLSHEEVYENARLAGPAVEKYFIKLIERLPEHEIAVPEFCPLVGPSVPIRRLKRKAEFTDKDLTQATKLVAALNFGERAPSLAFFVYGVSRLSLANRREIHINELPGFPQYSVASNKAKLVVASFLGGRAVFVLTQEIEGFEIVEASYLVLLMTKVGVGHLHCSFLSEGVSGSGGIEGVKDYFAHNSQLAAINEGSEPTQISPLGDCLVWAWPGPTQPTPAERSVSITTGFDKITIADLSVLNAANSQGLKHSASTFTSSFSDPKVPDLIPYFESLTSLPATSPDFSFFQLPTTYPTPLNLQSVKNLATQIKESQSKLILMFSRRFSDQIKPHFTITSSHFDSQSDVLVHFTSDSVVLIEGIPKLIRGSNIKTQLYTVFAFNLSGVRDLIILDEATSDSIEVGTWVAFKDHCILAGVNPLFGDNVNEWGVRFPDASSLYSAELRTLAENKFASAGVPFLQVNAVHTDSARSVHGPALRSILQFLEADVVTATGVHAAIISSHRNPDSPPRRVLLLAEVTRSLNGARLDVSNCSTALQLVDHLKGLEG